MAQLLVPCEHLASDIHAMAESVEHNSEQCKFLSKRAGEIVTSFSMLLSQPGQHRAEMKSCLQSLESCLGSARELVFSNTAAAGASSSSNCDKKFEEIHRRLDRPLKALVVKLMDESTRQLIVNLIAPEVEAEEQPPAEQPEWFLNYDDLEFERVGQNHRRLPVRGCISDAMFKATLQGVQVIVKEFESEQLLVPAYQKQFSTEIHVLFSLKHKNIVAMLGAAEKRGEFDSPPFIVLEYFTTTLYGALFSDAPVPELQDLDTAVRIAGEVASALDYLHLSSPRIVHHDVSLVNVMLTPGALQAKLIGFGNASTIATKAATRDVVDAAGDERGTLWYKAPEKLRADDLRACVSHKVDVYAFGMLLCQLVSKKLFYDVMDVYQITGFILSGEPLPALPAVPTWLHQLVSSCHATDAKNRPEMSDVLSCLRACGSGDYLAFTDYVATNDNEV